MYKDRIKKWNLDKKTKEEEAWAILRKQMRREAAGKESAFRVRGKAVTIDDVLRYFKRKGILDPETRPQPPGPPTPPAIECWTPLPSPNPESAFMLEIEGRGVDWPDFGGVESSGVQACALGSPQSGGILGSLDVNQTRQILFSDPEIQSFEIPSSPLPPQSLVVLEKVFASITIYFSGAFDGGLFKTDDDGYLIHSTNEVIEGSGPVDFYNLCAIGITLMVSNRFREGRRFFSKALSITKMMLRNQHPRTLDYVFCSLSVLRSEGYNEMAILLRTYMRDITALIFADEHPWRQLFSQLAVMEESQFQFALTEACRCIQNTFANILGQFHRTALSSHLEFLRIVENRSNAFQLLHDLFIRGEQELGKFDEKIVEIKYQFAVALYENGEYAEAIEILEEVLVRCKKLEGFAFTVCDSLDTIASSRHLLGRHEENDELRLREAIGRIEEVVGRDHAYVLSIKTRQETRLRKLGRATEAAEVQAEVNEALGPDDIELESNYP
jgi:tetratricopeptide (TPR) repeat protein